MRSTIGCRSSRSSPPSWHNSSHWQRIDGCIGNHNDGTTALTDHDRSGLCAVESLGRSIRPEASAYSRRSTLDPASTNGRRQTVAGICRNRHAMWARLAVRAKRPAMAERDYLTILRPPFLVVDFDAILGGNPVRGPNPRPRRTGSGLRCAIRSRCRGVRHHGSDGCQDPAQHQVSTACVIGRQVRVRFHAIRSSSGRNRRTGRSVGHATLCVPSAIYRRD